MQHCPARAAQRLAAAVLALVLLLCAFLPRAHAAELKEKNGIRLLSFDTSHILSIGNQTSGKCSLYALRYARTILDGKVCSGSGMWSNGAVVRSGLHWVLRHPRRVPEKAVQRAFHRASGDRAPEKHHSQRGKAPHEPHLYL